VLNEKVHVLLFINYWIEKCTVKHWSSVHTSLSTVDVPFNNQSLDRDPVAQFIFNPHINYSVTDSHFRHINVFITSKMAHLEYHAAKLYGGLTVPHSLTLLLLYSRYRLYNNYQLWCADYYLFIKYYSPLHVSSLKCSSSGGYSCKHAAYGTVTLYESSWWPVGT